MLGLQVQAGPGGPRDHAAKRAAGHMGRGRGDSGGEGITPVVPPGPDQKPPNREVFLLQFFISAERLR